MQSIKWFCPICLEKNDREYDYNPHRIEFSCSGCGESYAWGDFHHYIELSFDILSEWGYAKDILKVVGYKNDVIEVQHIAGYHVGYTFSVNPFEHEPIPHFENKDAALEWLDYDCVNKPDAVIVNERFCFLDERKGVDEYNKQMGDDYLLSERRYDFPCVLNGRRAWVGCHEIDLD